MLAFFRRLINSRVGVVVTLVFLVLVAVLFGLGDVLGLRGGGGRATGDAIAKVGGETITATQLRQQVSNAFARAAGEQPGLTMPAFVAQGGVEATLERLIGNIALDRYGRKQGMVISRRMQDGEIASLPQLQDAAGRFDQASYERLLGQAGLTDRQFHDEVRQNITARLLVGPITGPQPVGKQFADAYASMLLESRQGQIGLIPSAAMPAGAAPSDADLARYYALHRVQYLVPERRVVRYALVTADALKARAAPTDAELAAEYASRKAEFAAAEKRSLVAVTVLDEKAAADLAAKVKGGADPAAAARAAGLEPQVLTSLGREQLATQTSPAVASAVFAAPQGAVVGPVRGGLGFVVAKVTKVEQVAGKSLAEVRPQLVEAVTARKVQTLLAQARAQAEDALNNKANFSEVAAALHVPVATTPPLTANATDPDHPDAKPDPALAPLVAAAFQAQVGDPPALAPAGQDGSFALVSLDRTVPAAPPPLAQIRDRVIHDYQLARQSQAARQVAGAVLAKVNAGTPLAQALAATGLKLPAPRPIGAQRGSLTQAGSRVPPPLALLFSDAMTAGTTRLLEVPGNAGWYVIRLDKITAGDASKDAALTARVSGEFGRIVGREQTDQFVRAVEAELKVSRNAEAIARLKAELSGQTQGGGDQG